MSALAVFLKKEGNDVSGSDSNPENHILYENGISVFNKANLKKIEECDVVTFSSAIKEDNEDLKYAKHLGKKILSRGELLGEISKKYKNVIAVAGSHGKTTTTALIYNVLKMAGKNPTLHLGGILKEENSNFVIGDKEYFVTEACEYCDNFLFLKPTISVVTNIEPEHLDYFKTFENIKKAFEKYDVLLTPTSPTVAFDIGSKINDPLAMYLADICTVSVNIAGLPGISIPCGVDSKGMPVGMQLIGNRFAEETLLNAAYTFEQKVKFREKYKPEFKK